MCRRFFQNKRRDFLLSGARKFNPEKIKMEDIARSGGGSTGEDL
jgi:hypothetical protein